MPKPLINNGLRNADDFHGVWHGSPCVFNVLANCDYILSSIGENQQKHDIFGSARQTGIYLLVRLIQNSRARQGFPFSLQFFSVQPRSSVGRTPKISPNKWSPLAFADSRMHTNIFGVRRLAAVFQRGRFSRKEILKHRERRRRPCKHGARAAL